MSKIVAFGASSSQKSINQQLATWAASQLESSEVTILDLNDYEMPIYSIDKEQKNGIPQKAHAFRNLLKTADGIIISFAEHNGSYTAAFKNILDWMSRIERPIWLDKPMFLLATSPGARGGQLVLSIANRSFPHQGGQVIASFSLPSFEKNFNTKNGVTDTQLKEEFNYQLTQFIKAIDETKDKQI